MRGANDGIVIMREISAEGELWSAFGPDGKTRVSAGTAEEFDLKLALMGFERGRLLIRLGGSSGLKTEDVFDVYRIGQGAGGN